MVVEVEQGRAEGEDCEGERGLEGREAAGEKQVKDEEEERPEDQVDGFEAEDIERGAAEGERREERGEAPRVGVGTDELGGHAHCECIALDEVLRLAFGDGDGLHEIGGPVVAPIVVEVEEAEGEEEGEENQDEGEDVFFHCVFSDYKTTWKAKTPLVLSCYT